MEPVGRVELARPAAGQEATNLITIYSGGTEYAKLRSRRRNWIGEF